MKIFGKGFNFGQDGPGNRLVYHLSGCNMHCAWCSNPEGISGHTGKVVAPAKLLAECKSCVPMFFSGGGVTFTGGEATLQEQELLWILKRLKQENIHTAIETNGTSKNLLSIAEFVDYLMMDFKHYNSEILKKFTGVGNETVKNNFEKLCQSGQPLHIRIPLIHHINTNSPESFASYFARFANPNVDFELLPYHEYGKEKWQSEYKIHNGFITTEILNSFIHTFQAYGLKLVKS